MTELIRGKSDPANASSAAWADRPGLDTLRVPQIPGPAGFFFVLQRRAAIAGAHLAQRLFDYWLRRSLRKLTDQQLREAGIDPRIAGRPAA